LPGERAENTFLRFRLKIVTTPDDAKAPGRGSSAARRISLVRTSIARTHPIEVLLEQRVFAKKASIHSASPSRFNAPASL
jgi:hypothetical protein